MSSPKRTSVTVLITLAELAWLAAFALLFAYRSKVGELGELRRNFTTATNTIAQWEAKSSDTAKLLKQANESLAENQRLRDRLVVLEKSSGGVSPEEAARRLTAMQTELETLRTQLAGLPPNAAELNEQFRTTQARATELETQLFVAQSEIRHREAGEFSIRRELTGLPDGNLRRVIFLVDSSSSMKNSPSWDSARKLIRTWLEFLPVEECALVNFNDGAIGFPENGYLLVRQSDGMKLPEKREELLRAFDQVHSGTYTDLLRGLRRAYEYPPADVMVLFTDGQPHISTKGDAAFASDILKEVAKHRGVPILTVALGSFEIEGAGGPRPRINAPVAFMKELAHETGGSFLAR